MKYHLNQVLTRLQKFTRMDVRYLFSGGFFLTLTQVSSAIIGLVLTIAFANLISPEMYGTYKYVLATYTLLAIAAFPGIETAMMRAIARGNEKAFKTAVILKMRWSLLAGVASLVYAFYNFSIGEETLGTLFVLVAIALPFMETGSLYPSYFNAKKQYKLWSIIDIIIQIISAICILAVLYFSKNIMFLMIAYLLPPVITRIILTYIVYKQVPDTATDDSDLSHYAQSLTVFQILTRLIASIDQIVLFHFLGPASVAIFSIANSIPGRIKGVLKISGTLAFPKFAKRTGEDMYKTMPRKMALFFVVILIICIGYAMTLPVLFTYLFPKYHASILFSQVLVFFNISCITYPFSSYLFAHKKIRENYILVVISFSAKLLSLVVFVPLYGIWGAVIGTLAAATTTILCTFYFVYAARHETQPVTSELLNQKAI